MGSWVGVDPYSSAYTNFFDKIRPTHEEILEEEEEEEDQNGSPEIETLPLFPMHGEDTHDYCNFKSNSSSNYNYDGTGWYHQADPRTTSLELSLNSYTRRSPDYA